MTKQEWNSIRIGTVVKQQLMKQWWYGYVVRINSNCSQVLVRWDGYNNETWEGRLRLELVQPQP